jgi:DNA adenine methylase
MTLFRYPGGKSKLVKKFDEHIPHDIATYYEPFMGGGSVALHVLKHDYAQRLVVNDIDPWMAAFWKVLFTGSDQDYSELVYMLESCQPNLEAFYHNREIAETAQLDDIDRAFLAMFFNRTTFSGILTASPIGGKNQETAKYKVGCRYNGPRIVKEMLRIRLMSRRTPVEVMEGDFAPCVTRATRGDFIYADPPYWVKGDMLYTGDHQRMEGGDAHNRLVACLRDTQSRWLLSYDDCREVRANYAWASGIRSIDATYTIQGAKRENKKTTELLIANYSLQPDVDFGADIALQSAIVHHTAGEQP